MTGIGLRVVQRVHLHVFSNMFIEGATSGSQWDGLIVFWLSEDLVPAPVLAELVQINWFVSFRTDVSQFVYESQFLLLRISGVLQKNAY